MSQKQCLQLYFFWRASEEKRRDGGCVRGQKSERYLLRRSKIRNCEAHRANFVDFSFDLRWPYPCGLFETNFRDKIEIS